MPVPLPVSAALLLALSLNAAAPLLAQDLAMEGRPGAPQAAKTDDDDAAPKIKFTPTRMGNSDGSTGMDLNLRWSGNGHYTWLAWYYDSLGRGQWRTGYEYRLKRELYRVTVSPQVAGGGYLSASVLGEIGGLNFAILGWGRSNLRDSYSLFPDPADAITFGAGSHAIRNLELSAFQLWDNRLHTGRRVNHLLARWKLPDQQRLTIDLSNKFGPDSNGRQISGSSYNITYDFPEFFIRVARDAYVGFAPFNQTRLAIGFTR